VGVRKAWDANLRAWRRNPGKFMDEVNTWIMKHKPKRFRWHVGGDIQGQEYLKGMCIIAEENPGTKFLAFTKAVTLDFKGIPPNLTIRISTWPGWAPEFSKSAKRLPVAAMDDGSEDLKGLEKCGGSCIKCTKCWTSRKGVSFHKH